MIAKLIYALTSDPPIAGTRIDGIITLVPSIKM